MIGIQQHAPLGIRALWSWGSRVCKEILALSGSILSNTLDLSWVKGIIRVGSQAQGAAIRECVS